MDFKPRVSGMPLRFGAALVLGGGVMAGAGSEADAFPIIAPEGNFVAYLSTFDPAGEGGEENLPIAQASPFDDDISNDGNDEFDKALLTIIFSVEALPSTIGPSGNVGPGIEHLRFDMAVLTGELNEEIPDLFG